MNPYSGMAFTGRLGVVAGFLPDAVVQRLADPRALDLFGREFVIQLRDDGLDAEVHPHGLLDCVRAGVSGFVAKGRVELLDDVLVGADPDPDGRAFVSHYVTRASTRAKVVAKGRGVVA